MAQDRVFVCEECAEEFVVAGSLYAWSGLGTALSLLRQYRRTARK